VIPPSTHEELIEQYGDPTPYLYQDGTISPKWELKILVMVNLPAPIRLGWTPPGFLEPPMVSRIRCHQLVAAPLLGVYQDIHSNGHWDRLKTFDGCYVWRRQRGTAVPSLHCWGLAVDHNAYLDPQGDTVIDMPGEIVQAFANHGFSWGGRFKGARIDAQHFQFARGVL
jgi:hypothetical protein